MTRKEAKGWLSLQNLPTRSLQRTWLWIKRAEDGGPHISSLADTLGGDNYARYSQLELRAYPSDFTALRLPVPRWKEVGRDT